MINILIVEDEFITSRFLEDILKELGDFSIDIVEDAHSAIEVVKSKTIDIAFMDINIQGGMDGIQCAISLNSFYSIPIIFISAYCDEETITDAGDANIYGYIIKPFSKVDISIALKVVKKIKKPQETKQSHTIELKNNYSFDKKDLILKHNDIEFKLSKKEQNIIHTLVLNMDKSLSYETLKIEVWNDRNILDSVVRDAISRLRKKLPDIGIENLTNIGYKIC